MKISTCAVRPILESCSLESCNYQIDTYMGCEHLCYYCYALNKAEMDWSKEIHVHQDLISRLEKELDAIPPQKIYLGYHTDPYQPCEADQLQTRKVLELLLSKGFSVSILTKSDLVVRDIDILQKMENASVSVSVAFSDNQVRQKFEYKTMDTEDRIAALPKLKKAGIGTSALICPVIPYISEVTPLIDMLEPYAKVIWIYGLSFLDQTEPGWQNVKSILSDHFPQIKNQVETVVFNREHSYWSDLREQLIKMQDNRELNLNIHI